MYKLLFITFIESCVATIGQVFLKAGLNRMEPLGWSWCFIKSVLFNWQFALGGLCFATTSLLWMYILKHYPFSMAMPMLSFTYVLGMIVAVLFFHETVPVHRWLGVALIVCGCWLVAK